MEGTLMERRRQFLTLSFAAAVGAAAFALGAQAAPLPPMPVQQGLIAPGGEAAAPAVVGQDEVDHLKPEQVRWHHHWHRWHHRHWRHRHWRHRRW
jgi:hypothetical protein